MRTGHLVVTRLNVKVTGLARPDDATLRRRLELLERFTAPSLARQEQVEFRWLVLCDPGTPPWLEAELATVASGFPFHMSFGRPSRHALTRELAHFDVVLTTRIDSDDVLHPTALARVRDAHLAEPSRYEAFLLARGYLYDLASGHVAPVRSERGAFTTKVNRVGVDDPLDVGGNHRTVMERLRTAEIEGERGAGLFVRTLHDCTMMGLTLGSTPVLSATQARAVLADFRITEKAVRRRGPDASPAVADESHVVTRPWRADDALVTVSVPHVDDTSRTERAVASVLDQTLGDVMVVVTNGTGTRHVWSTLARIDDRRLVRFDGLDDPLLAHQAVLETTTSEYFLALDPDGWCRPDALGRLVAAGRRTSAGAVLGGRVGHVETIAGDAVIDLPPVALLRSSTLRDAGGCYGGLDGRGLDLAVELARMLAPVGPVIPRLFHQSVRISIERPEPAGAPELRREATSWCLAYLDGDCTREHLEHRLHQLAVRSWPLAITESVSAAAASLRRTIASPPGTVRTTRVRLPSAPTRP
jgi:hypothetical protein